MTAILLDDSTGRKMSDAEFERFCRENPDLRIERNSNLEVSIMSPVSTEFSYPGSAVTAQLFTWSIADKRGLAFDSSAGFTLPDNSILSPDASWVSKELWFSLSTEQRAKFAHVCPEFVIEIRSETDRLKTIKEKVQVWLRNGAKLVWLIDPIEEVTLVTSPGEGEKIITGFDGVVMEGEGPVKGFALDMSLLKIKR
ncbi:MAG TPA: Uma2 family endonuclease [Chryseosolibacter sp.]